MSPQDTLAVVLLGVAFAILVTLPPVYRPAGWPCPKHIADRVMLWGIAVMVSIILSTIGG